MFRSQWRRVDTLVALAAVVLASLAALQIRGRVLFAIAAVLLLLYVIGSRFRATLLRRRVPQGFDAYQRAEQIREERSRRSGR